MRRRFQHPAASLLSDTRAATALEFGLVGSVFFALLLMIVETGLAMFQQSVLDNAARDAARYIRVHPSNYSNVINVVCGELSGITSAGNCNAALASGTLQYCLVNTGSSFPTPSATVSASNNVLTCNGTANAVSNNSDMVLTMAYRRSFAFGWMAQIWAGSSSATALIFSIVPFQAEPASS